MLKANVLSFNFFGSFYADYRWDKRNSNSIYLWKGILIKETDYRKYNHEIQNYEISNEN